MSNSALITSIITSVALLGSAFFSASETALFSIPRERIFAFQNTKQKNYQRIYLLLRNGQQTLLMILLGNVFVNISLAGLVHNLLVHFFSINSELYTLIIASVIIVIFCEIVPKNIALRNNEKIAKVIAPIMLFLIKAFSPLLKGIQSVNAFFLYRVRVHLREPDPFVTVDELKSGLEKSIQNGAISSEEGKIIDRILELGPLPVRKYMIHRSKLLLINKDDSVKDVLGMMQTEQSYFALVQNKFQPLQIDGIVTLSAIISAPPQKSALSYSKHPIWVPESTEVAELIGFLLENKQDIACLLDEFGGFNGVFSTNSAIQAIFADLFGPSEIETFAKSITLRGSQEIDSVVEFIPQRLRASASDYRTINGLITNYLGRIPKSGETFAIDEYKFYIISSGPTKIDTIFIQKGDHNDG